MFRMIRAGLVCCAVMGVASMVHGQEPTAPQTTAPGGTAAAGGAPAIPGATEVLATVTSRGQTSKVTKADVIGLLSRYPMPPADEREISYNRALELLINTHLLNHYLVSQRVQVPESRIDEQIERTKQQLKRDGQDLPTLLLQSGRSLADLRKDLADQLRFSEFATTRATNSELQNYLHKNRDLFSGTQVRASHILLKVEPGASKADKEKIERKLEAIRKEIVGGKISFAAAANKYSEDPANAGGAGGTSTTSRSTAATWRSSPTPPSI